VQRFRSWRVLWRASLPLNVAPPNNLQRPEVYRAFGCRSAYAPYARGKTWFYVVFMDTTAIASTDQGSPRKLLRQRQPEEFRRDRVYL
jgi:hypothetical protein